MLITYLRNAWIKRTKWGDTTRFTISLSGTEGKAGSSTLTGERCLDLKPEAVLGSWAIMGDHTLLPVSVRPEMLAAVALLTWPQRMEFFPTGA